MTLRILACLTASLLTFPTSALAQGLPGSSTKGTQQVFNLADVTDDQTGQITASTNYQISLILPMEVQNVGVNASKQDALIPTVDQSDGRVIYLDVLKSGGYATLNIRLVNPEPLIVKLNVQLTENTKGILTYTVQKSTAALATVVPAPVPSVAVPPKPQTRIQNGVQITLTPTAGETGLTRTYRVQVRAVTAPLDVPYRISALANAAANGHPAVQSVQFTPQAARTLATDLEGTLTVQFSEDVATAIILFDIRQEKSTQTRSGNYVGFKVKL